MRNNYKSTGPAKPYNWLQALGPQTNPYPPSTFLYFTRDLLVLHLLVLHLLVPHLLVLHLPIVVVVDGVHFVSVFVFVFDSRKTVRSDYFDSGIWIASKTLTKVHRKLKTCINLHCFQLLGPFCPLLIWYLWYEAVEPGEPLSCHNFFSQPRF